MIGSLLSTMGDLARPVTWTLFDSRLKPRSLTMMSTSREAGYTMARRPLGFRSLRAVSNISSKEVCISCLAMAFCGSGLIRPASLRR